ncbi:MAG: phage major tail tube protein [Candidatus Gastranaerophilales bacterium]|nr:phage major tail tube protein [Candidatus Gastranaerophilales bacterium]
MVAILSNAHLYLGASLFGKISEFKFPDIEAQTVESKPIDSIGTTDYPVGLSLSDSSITFIGFNPEAYNELADIYKEHVITMRGNLRVYNGQTLKEELPIKATVRATTKKITPLGTIKGQENAEFQVELNPVATKIEYKGKILQEIDIPNNIYIVDGVDKLATMRANLGL